MSILATLLHFLLHRHCKEHTSGCFAKNSKVMLEPTVVVDPGGIHVFAIVTSRQSVCWCENSLFLDSLCLVMQVLWIHPRMQSLANERKNEQENERKRRKKESLDG